MKPWLQILLFPAALLQAVDEVYELQPLTVTLYHFPQLVSETPARVEILDRHQLRSQPALFLPEAMKNGLGLDFKSYSGNRIDASPSMRGWTGGSRQVLILLNGHKLNRSDMGALNWGLIPISQIEQIELIRGSQSVIYGNHAVAGVLKITTREPIKPEAELRLTAGSWNLRQAGGSWGTSWGGGSITLDTDHIEEEGYRQHSQYQVGATSMRGSFAIGRKWKLQYRLSGIDSRIQLPGGLTDEQFRNNPRQAGLNIQSNDETALIGSLRLYQQTHDDNPAEIIAGWAYRDLDWGISGSSGHNRMRSFSLQGRKVWQWDKLRWVNGTDLLADMIDFNRLTNFPQTRPYTDANLDRYQIAAYSHATYKITEKQEILFGARIEWTELGGREMEGHPFRPDEPWTVSFDERKNDLDGAVQIAWNARPFREGNIWVRLDRFYRYPVIDEIVAYQGYILEIPFNSDLQPEWGWSGEAGMSAVWLDTEWSLGIFRQDVHDEIHFDPSRPLNVNLPRNLRQGIETEARTDIGDHSLRLGWVWTDARYSEGSYAGKKTELVPRHQINGNWSWRFIRGWESSASVRYRSEQIEGNDFDNVRPRMPSVVVWDLDIRWQPTPHWHISAGIQNLTDKNYASIKFGGLWYPEAGRSCRLQVRYTF